MTARLIIGMTGATGAIYGVRLLEALRDTRFETHLVATDWARKNIAIETDYQPEAVLALADRTYRPDNQAAAISSGSFLTDGMIIAPCSVKTLAAIASGFADNLVARAADVTLKERRRLVLLVRESPLHAIHLENMLKVTQAGAIVVPPVPAFYSRPRNLDDIVNHTVGRLLDLVGGEHSMLRRWGNGNQHR